jgi:hypothetical protein
LTNTSITLYIGAYKRREEFLMDRSSQRIICDNNVWYKIGNGEVSPNEFKNIKLIATYLNLLEIGSTENLLKDFKEVKSACNAILTYADEIWLLNPIEYLIQLGQENYKGDLSDGQFKLDEIKNFVSLNDDYLSSRVKLPEFKPLVEKFDEPLLPSTNFINGVSGQINANIRSSYGKKAHRKIDKVLEIRDLVKSMVSQSGIDCDIDWKCYNWSKVELFLNTMAEYFRELELSQMKMSKNDWPDLFNLIYVGPNDQLWTFEEKKWARIMKSNERFSHYFSH